MCQFGSRFLLINVCVYNYNAPLLLLSVLLLINNELPLIYFCWSPWLLVLNDTVLLGEKEKKGTRKKNIIGA